MTEREVSYEDARRWLARNPTENVSMGKLKRRALALGPSALPAMIEVLARGTADEVRGAFSWYAVNGARAGVDSGQHHDEVIGRLRSAASTNAPVDVRTALVLSMTGPANLLELIAPNRGDERRRARRRIDHAADDTPFDCLPKIVRKLIADANAAAVVVAPVPVFGG